MKKSFFKRPLLILFLTAIMAAVPLTALAEQSSDQAIFSGTVQKGKYTITLSYDYTVKNNVLTVANGEKTKTVSNVSAAITDGKYLYYALRGSKLKGGNYKNSIRRMTLSSFATKKITSGTNSVPVMVRGSYLYYGRDQGPDGVKLYARNLKTKKSKYIYGAAGLLRTAGSKYVLVMTNSGAVGNYPIYICKNSGAGKKKLTTGVSACYSNKKVYYYKVNVKTWKYKLYRCTTSGKSKKALTGWTSMKTIQKKCPKLFK